MKVIALHSYKGGTGKTLLTTNLAAIFAQAGKKVALLDFDFRGSNLNDMFSKYHDETSQQSHSLNKYINTPKLKASDILVDFSSSLGFPLFACFVDTDFEKIAKIIRANKKERQENLKRILQLQDELRNMEFDIVLIDNSPGIQLESIDGLVISDLILLALKKDDWNNKGVKKMATQLYQLLDSKYYVVLNRVLEMSNDDSCCCGEEEPISGDFFEELATKTQESINVELLHAIRCHCKVADYANEGIFILEYPDHAYSESLHLLKDAILTKL